MTNGTTLQKAMIDLPGGATAVYTSSGFGYFRHKDWLGSSRLATKWDHSIYSKTAYAPFGETYNTSGTSDASFTGQDQDTLAGLYTFLYRHYNPSSGRWISPDPAGWNVFEPEDPQSLNRYAYVKNQPLTYLDADGQSAVCPGNKSPCTETTPTLVLVQSTYMDNATSLAAAMQLWGKNPGAYSAGTYYGPGSKSTGPSASGGGSGNAPNNAPLTPEQLHKQQQTKLNQKCAAATASSAALATTAGLNEGAALLTGEITPFAAIFHGIAVVEGIGAGGVGIYAAFACYNAAQF